MADVDKKPSMKIFSPFGPAIAGFKMSDDLVDALNEDCEKADRDMSHKLIGKVEKQLRFSDEFLKKHGKIFNDLADRFLVEVCHREGTNKISAAWYNRMLHPGEYNPMHVHPGCLLTSVGYLKLPKGFKELSHRELPNGIGGGLELFYGEEGLLGTTKSLIVGEVGDFFIFPATLRHTVHPMPEDMTEERRSFSINFVADDFESAWVI